MKVDASWEVVKPLHGSDSPNQDSLSTIALGNSSIDEESIDDVVDYLVGFTALRDLDFARLNP